MENQTNQQNIEGQDVAMQSSPKRNTRVIVLISAIVVLLLCFAAIVVIAGKGTTGNSAIKNSFMGTSYQARDDSVIYFEEDGTFKWYRDDSDHSDNYYAGTFDVYIGDDAKAYIINELEEYGVTQSELKDYFRRNEDSDFYVEENFFCMTLHTEALIMGGENQRDEEYDKNYMGFFKEGIFDGANMDSGESAYFELVE